MDKSFCCYVKTRDTVDSENISRGLSLQIIIASIRYAKRFSAGQEVLRAWFRFPPRLEASRLNSFFPLPKAELLERRPARPNWSLHNLDGRLKACGFCYIQTVISTLKNSSTKISKRKPNQSIKPLHFHFDAQNTANLHPSLLWKERKISHRISLNLYQLFVHLR